MDTKIINLCDYKSKRYNALTMVIWCAKTFGGSSDNTWKIINLTHIIFYHEKYYTMFILKWGNI